MRGHAELDEYELDDEFWQIEHQYLIEAGFPEFLMPVLVALLDDLSHRSRSPNALPASEDVRSEVLRLADDLRSAQDSGDQSGSFWRKVGRGVLVVGGGLLVAADGAVFVGTAGAAGMPAVVSMGIGMAGVVKGTFDDPYAGGDLVPKP